MTRINVDRELAASIRTLKDEAGTAGDLRMAMICDLALHGPETLAGAEDGSEADLLREEGMTQGQALDECRRVIETAAAERVQ